MIPDFTKRRERKGRVGAFVGHEEALNNYYYAEAERAEEARYLDRSINRRITCT